MNINDIPNHVFDAAELAYKAEKWASPKIRLRYAITQALNLMPSELERLRMENEALKTALQDLHDDIMDYSRLNKLGAENNHWLVIARHVLQGKPIETAFKEPK